MTAALLASYVLALIFVWAAAAKFFGFRRWAGSLGRYVPDGGLARVVAVAVPVAEAIVALVLLAGFRSIGAALALALVAGFSAAILRASRDGSRLPCGCFGGTKERDFRAMLLRNAGIAALSGIILVGQRFRPTLLQGPVDGVPLLLSLVGAAVIGWTLWQVLSSLRGRRHI